MGHSCNAGIITDMSYAQSVAVNIAASRMACGIVQRAEVHRNGYDDMAALSAGSAALRMALA
jgi:hypothetical protein